MLRTVHYGPYSFAPWCSGTGFVDKEAKSLKSYRSREPRSIWQVLPAKSDDLGEYDLYFCPNCLLYTSLAEDISSHSSKCRYREGPPGKVVFEDDKFKILEVHTAASLQDPPPPPPPSNVHPPFDSIKLYLQCLSLFGHLFLDTKSICFSVDAFIFYTAVEKESNMVAGFFSKEVQSWHDYNLACIVIFPPWQKHGLGQRLIAFSYLLSQHAKKTGSPEKPLSKHGQMAYDSYWTRTVLQYCASKRNVKKLTLSEIARDTGIDAADLASLLKRKGGLENKRLKVKLLMRAKGDRSTGEACAEDASSRDAAGPNGDCETRENSKTKGDCETKVDGDERHTQGDSETPTDGNGTSYSVKGSNGG